MDKKEQELYDSLITLSKKFTAEWANVYYLDLSKTFSINLPGFSSDELPLLTKFCDKYNLYWSVVQALGANERGINILFRNKLITVKR